jgi:hypothetical protein
MQSISMTPMEPNGCECSRLCLDDRSEGTDLYRALQRERLSASDRIDALKDENEKRLLSQFEAR